MSGPGTDSRTDPRIDSGTDSGTERLPGWLLRPWRLVRRDIGRKATALGCALLLWGVLENLVVGENRAILDVRSVPTSEVADHERASAANVYVVVPPELILRKVSNPKVTLHVKGLKDDVANINMSAVVTFDPASLGDNDEKTFAVPLDRELFKSRGDPPQLTYFRVNPDALKITLAKSATADITLSSANVTMIGKPRQGFFFQESRIGVHPNLVTVSGPKAEIEKLRADPSRLQLTPVNIDGRSGTVTQFVGLPLDLVDADVTLHAPNGAVEVSIYLVPEDKTVDLLDVPVIYLNADSLTTRKLRVAKTNALLNVKVVGPQPELDTFTPDQLRQRIFLIFDWRDAPDNFIDNRPKVHVSTEGLSDGVRVVDPLTGEEPHIRYTLESIPEPK